MLIIISNSITITFRFITGTMEAKNLYVALQTLLPCL